MYIGPFISIINNSKTVNWWSGTDFCVTKDCKNHYKFVGGMCCNFCGKPLAALPQEREQACITEAAIEALNQDLRLLACFPKRTILVERKKSNDDINILVDYDPAIIKQEVEEFEKKYEKELAFLKEKIPYPGSVIVGWGTVKTNLI